MNFEIATHAIRDRDAVEITYGLYKGRNGTILRFSDEPSRDENDQIVKVDIGDKVISVSICHLAL